MNQRNVLRTAAGGDSFNGHDSRNGTSTRCGFFDEGLET
jgi:hypothetical protein